VFGSHLTYRLGYYSPANLNLAHFGVVLFFVHTALVLMFSLERLSADGKGKETLRFYIRRAFRIYPLSVASVVALCLVPGNVNPGAAQPKVVVSSLLLIQNLTHSASVQSVMWSLPFEVQMYMLLPIVFVLLRRSLAAAAWLWLLGFLLSRSATLSFITAYFPCFLAGVVAYAVQQRFQQRIRSGWWIVTLVAVTVAYSFLADTDRLDWVPALAIGVSVPLFEPLRPGWLTRAAHAIAKYSYGIYLTHSPLITLAFFQLQWPMPVRWLLFLVLAAALPVLAFHLVEQPMIHVGARLADWIARNRGQRRRAADPYPAAQSGLG
jgi:peptidoglycan/LPS O-acetylase OafA/YrhL